jgi:hypothetical protein
MKFGVREEVNLPEGKQALPSFFIFEVKRDGRYKARLVAGGHRQQQGLDFEETYASVGSYRTMRMMMAVAAHENLELRQFDVRTAFLNGWLKEEVYLRVPAGLERKLGTSGKVLRLRRAIYGLKQTSRAWNERLEGELARKGFVQSDTDPSLWILHGKDGAVLALFYVDDGLVAAKRGEEADALVELVGSIFEIRKLGEPVDFLGIEIQRDRGAGTITLTQTAKAEVLAAEHGVQGACRVVPMSPESFSSLRAAQTGEPMADKLGYQKVIGSLLHLAQCTRPDIALPVGALAAYASAPSEAHYEAMLNVVRYVGSTTGWDLTYGVVASLWGSGVMPILPPAKTLGAAPQAGCWECMGEPCLGQVRSSLLRLLLPWKQSTRRAGRRPERGFRWARRLGSWPCSHQISPWAGQW